MATNFLITKYNSNCDYREQTEQTDKMVSKELGALLVNKARLSTLKTEIRAHLVKMDLQEMTAQTVNWGVVTIGKL